MNKIGITGKVRGKYLGTLAGRKLDKPQRICVKQASISSHVFYSVLLGSGVWICPAVTGIPGYPGNRSESDVISLTTLLSTHPRDPLTSVTLVVHARLS